LKVSLRAKVTASLLVVVVATGAVATAVGVSLIGRAFVQQAQNKVRVDLNSARNLFLERMSDVRDVVRLTASSYFTRDCILGGRPDELRAKLERIRSEEGLDVLTLTNAEGVVICRAGNPESVGDSLADDPLVGRVMDGAAPVMSAHIVGGERLRREGLGLAERAHIEFVDTPRARELAESEQTSGMMIGAAAPVSDRDGRLIAVLYGGVLLNRDFEVAGPDHCIVDRVKDTVYQGETYRGKDIGTVTIFQDDVRISTNVMDSEGRRAIGTRVSEEVYERVVVEGGRWVAPAFVVNDWYITAYEPIRDIDGGVLGILYVGVLRQKYDDLERETLLRFLGITLLGMFGAVGAAYYFSRSLVGPLRDLTDAAHEFSRHNFAHRVVPRRRDELAELAEAFNAMAESVEERDRTILERQQQVMESKRLATLGQLAAGVAHELNNPLGSIVMYAHLLLENTGPDDPRRSNLDKVIRQATRCQNIVRNLLDFSRQSHPNVARADVNELVGSVLSSLSRQKRFQGIGVEMDLQADLPPVMVDVSQIEQVISNIAVNAADAMGGRGVLAVRTRLDGDCVELVLADTGPGVDPDHMDRLFEPFFTTKEVGHGTGLGLAVSHGIVERHGGSIAVANATRGGAVFTVRLPLPEGGES